MKSLHGSVPSKQLMLRALLLLFFGVLIICFVLFPVMLLAVRPRIMSSLLPSSSSTTTTATDATSKYSSDAVYVVGETRSVVKDDKTFDEKEGIHYGFFLPSKTSRFSSLLYSYFLGEAEKNQSPLEASAVTSRTSVKEPSTGRSSILSAPQSQSEQSVRALLSTKSQTPITYRPGQFPANGSITLGLLLSIGLEARLLAKSGDYIVYNTTGKRSAIPFHAMPDFGATYLDPRDGNWGGWIYVSNCEVNNPKNAGGVGALTFNRNGQIIDYRMVMTGTTANCGGGKTPWGSWISCEEITTGRAWQVDPTGVRPAQPLTLGSDGGHFESFSQDVRYGHYFVTEDDAFGPLRRFVPSEPTYNSNPIRLISDPWQVLHGNGETTFLVLTPSNTTTTTTTGAPGSGTFQWIKNITIARKNANVMYPNAEGIDVQGGLLYFVSKVPKLLFILDLDKGTYTSYSTKQGAFDGEPDQILRILDYNNEVPEGDVHQWLYFTEDGGKYAGVHARNREGQFITILETRSYTQDETTGLAFSPDAMHMYVAYQHIGLLFDITRQDGRPFTAATL